MVERMVIKVSRTSEVWWAMGRHEWGFKFLQRRLLCILTITRSSQI